MSLQLIGKVNRLKRLRQQRSKATVEESTQRNPYGVPESFSEFAGQCYIRTGADFKPFLLYDYQIEIGKLLDQCRGIAAWKTRQMGWSEVVACWMLHRALINPAYMGVAFSLGQEESSKLSDRVGGMPLQIPGFEWDQDSKKARKIKGAGELLFRPSTENAARSLASVWDLFFDEVAFPDKISSMYGSATPAQKMVGDNARRILGTTIPPEGLECWFGQTFWNNLPFDLEEEIERVKEGRGRQDRGFSYWIDSDGWARILLHWQSHPIYCQVADYLDRTKREEKLTEDQLQREHNLGIPKEGGSLFSRSAIEQHATGKWNTPQRNSGYLIGIDPNFGGNDEFVSQCWEIGTRSSLVHEYALSDRSMSYSYNKVLEQIDAYEPVIVAVESNAGGVKIAEDITRDRPHIRVELVKTSSVSKITNTDRIALALENGEVEFPSDWQGISQMRNFSASKRQALQGKDDRVMAWAVAWAWFEEATKNVYDHSWMSM